MSARRYVEGPDRGTLLARIDGQGGTVVEERVVRRGGILGFFARELVGVTYELPDPAPISAPAQEDVAQPEAPTLDDLLGAADAADGPGPVDAADGPGPVYAADGPAPVDDFARLLAAYAEQPEPRAPTAHVDPIAPREPAAGAGPALNHAPPEPHATHRLPARTRLDMLADLRGIGVPFQHAPQGGETSLYAAIEQVIDELPPAPLPPTRAGEILVLAGPVEAARRVATELAPQLHVPASAIWIAAGNDPSARRISGPRNASRRVGELKTGEVPAIVVVATDAPDLRGDLRPSWPAQVIAALDPTAVWAVVDARQKTEDLRAEVARLGPVQALVVDGAAQTSSPATVWDLDIPVALLDGRPATPGTWAALLFDALRATA